MNNNVKKRKLKPVPSIVKTQQSSTEEIEKPKQKVVKFVDNGRIEWEGFTNLYEVIGFMQLHIFQNWAHPIFQSTFLAPILKRPEPTKPIVHVVEETFTDEPSDEKIVDEENANEESQPQ